MKKVLIVLLTSLSASFSCTTSVVSEEHSRSEIRPDSLRFYIGDVGIDTLYSYEYDASVVNIRVPTYADEAYEDVQFVDYGVTMLYRQLRGHSVLSFDASLKTLLKMPKYQNIKVISIETISDNKELVSKRILLGEKPKKVP